MLPLKIHTDRNKYGKGAVKCPRCYYWPLDLDKHLKDTKHGTDTEYLVCNMCDKKFKTISSLAAHKSNIRSKRRFKCEFCEYQATTKGSLKGHTSSKHENKRYECPACVYKATSKSNLGRHVKSKHGSERFNCDECDKSFFFETELASHKKYHHTVHKCEQCDFTAWNPVKVREHLITKHTDPDFNPHVCTNCGKGFKLKMNLTRHMETHDTVKKHECKVCGKKFSANRHLYTHSKIHSKSYEAECNICNRKFVQKYNWRLHMRKQHPEVSDKSTDKKCKKEI